MKIIASLHKYEVSLFIWLFNIRMHARLIKLWRCISWTGDGPVYVTLMATLFWTAGIQDPLLKSLLLSFLLERPVYFVLKNGFKRNRPGDALPDFQSSIIPSDQFSFPSGHTSAAFLMATLLSSFYPALLAAFYSWAGAVGISRVVLGVHFPTDILMGTALGVCTAMLSLGVVLQ